MINTPSRFILLGGFISCACLSFAGEPFNGNWHIDLRNSSERRQGAECGAAEFKLTQSGDVVAGTHTMSAIGCGRVNEGGAVKGVVIGNTAVLVITSGRNGAIVMGTAKHSEGNLVWRTVDEVSTGNPDGDSPMILGAGLLVRSE